MLIVNLTEMVNLTLWDNLSLKMYLVHLFPSLFVYLLLPTWVFQSKPVNNFYIIMDAHGFI